MHCHARKDTLLACVDGEGTLIAGDGRRFPIAQGSVMRVQQGAAHRALTRSGMTLVEIDTPRDKFDHLRLEDDSGRAGHPYESADHVKQQLDPLQDVTNGPPRARLRPLAATGMHRFALERGLDLQPDVDGLMFAISLDAAGILRREIMIAGPEALTAIRPEHTYLTVRTSATPAFHPEGAPTPHAVVKPGGVANGRTRGRTSCAPSAEGDATAQTTRAVIVARVVLGAVATLIVAAIVASSWPFNAPSSEVSVRDSLPPRSTPQIARPQPPPPLRRHSRAGAHTRTAQSGGTGLSNGLRRRRGRIVLQLLKLRRPQIAHP
jgi:hypothetical protein